MSDDPECEFCGFRHSNTATHGSDNRHEVVHECPPGDSNLMPCCGKTPLEVPMFHRMSVDPKLVTCRGYIEV